MTLNPELDGITHINIYSKGKTTIGRALSNFAYLPTTEAASIEGLWYYLSTNHPDRELLLDMYGAKAKELGRKFKDTDPLETENFQELILKAIKTKYYTHPGLLLLVNNTTLPYEHYYVFGKDKPIVRQPEDNNWVIDYHTKVRNWCHKQSDLYQVLIEKKLITQNNTFSYLQEVVT